VVPLAGLKKCRQLLEIIRLLVLLVARFLPYSATYTQPISVDGKR
jgi:hypothetical protein